MRPPVLSVLMPVHQGEKYLKEAIISILKQSFTNFELVILDNQSTDKTKDIVKFFSNKDRRVRYILDSQKRNCLDAQSEIINFARGKYLTIVSDDNIMNTFFFERLIETIKKNKSYDWVVSNGYYFNENTEKKKKFYKNCYFYGEPNLYKILNFLLKRDTVPLILSAMTTVSKFKTELLPHVNISESEKDADVIIGIKILANFKIGYVNENLFFFRSYIGQERFEDKKYKKFTRNYLKYFYHFKNFSFFSFFTIKNSKLMIYQKIIFTIFFPIFLLIYFCKTKIIQLLTLLKYKFKI